MFELTDNGSVFMLNGGNESKTHEKPYTNIIDDLLSLVQCVVAGIASITSKVVNDNCLEFKISVSTKQPIIILRYELLLNHQYKNSSPILFNLLKLDSGLGKDKEAKSAKSVRNVEKDYLSVSSNVALQNVHSTRDVKGSVVKCGTSSSKPHQKARNFQGKFSEVKKFLDTRSEIALKKNNTNDHIEIIEIDSDGTSSKNGELVSFTNQPVQPILNPYMPQETFNTSLCNYYVGRNSRKANLRDDCRRQAVHPFVSNFHRDSIAIDSPYVLNDNVKQNDFYHVEKEYIGFQDFCKPLAQLDEEHKDTVEERSKENLFLHEPCLDEDDYQEVNALPVICILKEEESNDEAENFKNLPNGIRTFENEVNTSSDELYDDYQLPDDRHAQNKYCVQALKRFRLKRRYERMKTSKKLHTCSYCKKTFPTMFGKLQHENIHTEARPYSCRYCSKTFNTFSNKYGHERIHMGIKPYVCSYCGKSFGRNGDKVRHERIHTGEKPYNCSVCGRAFNQLSSKNQHEKLHTGEKPHICRFCGKSFACVSSKNRHEKIHF